MDVAAFTQEMYELSQWFRTQSPAPNASFVMQSPRVLDPNDLQLTTLVALQKKAQENGLCEEDRSAVIACIRGTGEQIRRTQSRLLSFRNVIVFTASIPTALAFLKLPTGALTALLGLILIRAGLVPGIKSLDSIAEIIAWALVFGYAQQLFTGVVDRQARSVLEQSGASAPSARGTAASPQ